MSDFDAFYTGLSGHASAAAALGRTLKFDFGGQYVYIDGTGAANVVSVEDKPADCTITVKLEDMKAIMDGTLNPMSAFMTGKMKVQGDMSVAMKLQSLLKS